MIYLLYLRGKNGSFFTALCMQAGVTIYKPSSFGWQSCNRKQTNFLAATASSFFSKLVEQQVRKVLPPAGRHRHCRKVWEADMESSRWGRQEATSIKTAKAQTRWRTGGGGGPTNSLTRQLTEWIWSVRPTARPPPSPVSHSFEMVAHFTKITSISCTNHYIQPWKKKIHTHIK